MSKELIAILEQMEREKGVDKEKLLEAIEEALEVAARKIAKITNSSEDISVKIDHKTGSIKAYVGDQEIVSEGLSRIAAQTARQIIIQKIREAEKDVVFTDFSEKVGKILSGSVYRFDKKGVVLDLLGKAEALIPKDQLSPLDNFKIGERIRVYCLEVRRDKSPQIMASRKAGAFVKKLFELEVPEIYEGVVEIKSIARDAGDRTKIAVYSKEDKIDSVGSCVGMRGARVKSVVNELRGEKIDIVRWSDNAVEFIKSALSPAKVKSISLDKDRKRALVIVDSEDLSVAIGKHGQNVRLASRLTNWELDVRSKEGLQEEQEELKKLEGVGQKILDILKDHNLVTLKSLANVSIEELTEIKGIGKKKAEGIIKQAKDLLSEQ